MTDRIRILVQGSAPNPYVVEFWREGRKLNATCSCAAAKDGMHCKHRLRLIDGDFEGLARSEITAALAIPGLAKGTTFEAAYQAVQDAEDALQLAKAELSRRKKAMAHEMGAK